MVDKVGLIGYADFVEKYLKPKRPCLFTSELTSSWKARRDWRSDEDGQINLDHFRSLYGDEIIPVADCKSQVFDSHEKTEMKMSDYLEYLQQTRSPAHLQEDEPVKRQVLYLKDWHFQRLYSDHDAYTVPSYFQSDWLNEYSDRCYPDVDDYRFVYIGPKGSWTPFHADVLRSHSWSANICGRKKWILYRPGDEEVLLDRFGQLPFDCTKPKQGANAELSDGKVAPIIVIQEQGEVIFIPSGWHHQVHNLEDTISINHNWINAYCIENTFQHLVGELEKVENEIGDCRDMTDWEGHCQLILKSVTGMDWKDLVDFLTTIALPRCEILKLIRDHKQNCGGGGGASCRNTCISIPKLFRECQIESSRKETQTTTKNSFEDSSTNLMCNLNAISEMALSIVTNDVQIVERILTQLQRRIVENKSCMDTGIKLNRLLKEIGKQLKGFKYVL